MLEDRDTRAPAWGWLRGFAYFLLAWPLLSLLALREFDFSDWVSIVLAILGPAAVGLVLLALEATLTHLLVLRMKLVPQAVPSVWRDLSNLGIAMAVLLVIDVLLVTAFDDDPMIRGGDPRAARTAVLLLIACCATALLFRGVARLLRGGPRLVDMGAGWDRAPTTTRLLGYLTLIPVLLVCTVMIDHALHGRDDEFGTTAWIVLPALLWLGLRSAMARAPRWWARDPWEAWLRQTSLALPWWLIGLAAALGFTALCLLIPAGLVDDEMTTRGRIVGGIVMIPLGLIVLFGAGMTLVRTTPTLLREWRTARRLTRNPADAVAWSTTKTPGQVHLTLADRRDVVFEMGDRAPDLLTWLDRR